MGTRDEHNIGKTRKVSPARVEDPNDVDNILVRYKYNVCQKEQQWTVTSMYRHCKVIEVFFEGEAASLREVQLVPFAQWFVCSFCHNSEVLPVKLWHTWPCASWIFSTSWRENAFKESRFQDIENIVKKVTTKLNVDPLDAFDNCFMQLLERCKKYFAVKYFLLFYFSSKKNKIIFFSYCISVHIDQVLELYCSI